MSSDTSAGNRCVVVTGGSRGLGFRIAEAFVQDGANVLIAGRDKEALDKAVSELGDNAEGVRGDVADEGFCDHLASVAVERHGAIDTFVANAGVSPVYQLAQDIDTATWRQILDINVTGTFLSSRAAAARMTSGSNVIITSSVLGIRPRRRLAPYSVSKAATEALVKALAIDFAEQSIRVNGVSPGWMDSDWTEAWQQRPELADRILSHTTMKRWGDISELVGAYLYLSSEQASFVTGTTIVVDGGYLLG